MTIFSWAPRAQAQSSSPLRCAFEKTAVLGASISGNIWSNPTNLEFIAKNKANRAKEEAWFYAAGLSPGDMLSQRHARKSPTYRATSYIGNSIRTGFKFIKDYYTKSDLDLFNGLSEATAVVGVDFFYFSAGIDECSNYGHERTNTIVRDFIRTVTRQKKVLILGTVPRENEAYLLIPPTLMGQTIMALPSDGADRDVESCRQTINQAIRQHCRAGDGCYIIHLDTIVEALNRTAKGAFPLPSPTRDATEKIDAVEVRTRDQIRAFDGLNITHEGSRIMYESVERQMRLDPPACAK